jgi:hypothetical protein
MNEIKARDSVYKHQSEVPKKSLKFNLYFSFPSWQANWWTNDDLEDDFIELYGWRRTFDEGE